MADLDLEELERLRKVYENLPTKGISMTGGKAATDYARALFAAAPALLDAAREGARLRAAVEEAIAAFDRAEAKLVKTHGTPEVQRVYAEAHGAFRFATDELRAALAGKGGGRG